MQWQRNGENKKTPNIQAKLAERKKKFENNFDVVTHNFEKSCGTAEHKAVICNNVQNVIDKACEHRNIDKEEYQYYIIFMCFILSKELPCSF